MKLKNQLEYKERSSIKYCFFQKEGSHYFRALQNKYGDDYEEFLLLI
jgi:hypothetical protein